MEKEEVEILLRHLHDISHECPDAARDLFYMKRLTLEQVIRGIDLFVQMDKTYNYESYCPINNTMVLKEFGYSNCI